jgi:hypothetical protein
MVTSATDIMMLSRRIDRLERENRRLRLAGLSAGVVLFFTLVSAFAFPQDQIVTAKEFILVDDENRTRVMLGNGRFGPVLHMYDEAGESALSMTAVNGASLITVKGSEGSTTIGASNEGPKVRLVDADGMPRVTLGRMSTEHARTGAKQTSDISSIGLYRNGREIWRAPATTW